jgi:FkbM family methyltransferase
MQNSLFLAKIFRKLKLIQNGYPRIVNFSLKKKINSYTFRVPIIRNIGWNNIFDNEPWMSQLLAKLLSEKKGAFIDVGANIGQTLLKVKSIDQELLYYGFEVNHVCLFYLNELIKANNFKSTSIIPVGLSDKTVLTSLNFFSKYSDDATASILEQIRPNEKIEKKEFVYVTRMDDLLENMGAKIAVLKIDVEGAEIEVLKGAVSSIRMNQPVIIVEILPAYSSENIWRIERQHEIEEFVKSINYKIIQIGKDKYNNLGALTFIEKLGVNSNIIERDYLLIPEGINLQF